MMANWSLPALLADFHQKIQNDLETARKLGHPTEKGDSSEAVWIDLFNRHLPKRYISRKGHVVDSTGAFSDQIDVIIHDQQYSPLVFSFKGTEIVPAESVYAVFEAKQEINAEYIKYAMLKAATVRRLYRTSLPVQTIDGHRAAKHPHKILAGILTLSSGWTPPLGAALMGNLQQEIDDGSLDMGCIADAGWFSLSEDAIYSAVTIDKAVTRFLFELIARLQTIGTVPMLDPRAYAAQI